MKKKRVGALCACARRQGGFSLIELMIIIAILGTLSAIAVPNILSYRDKARVRAGANEMLALFRKAQVTAVKRNYNAVIDMSVSGTITVYLDNGAGVLTDANNGTQDSGEPEIAKFTVPPGCIIPAANITFTGKQTGFNPRGLPIISTNGTVEIHSASASSKNAYGIVLSMAGHSRIDVIHL